MNLKSLRKKTALVLLGQKFLLVVLFAIVSTQGYSQRWLLVLLYDFSLYDYRRNYLKLRIL